MTWRRVLRSRINMARLYLRRDDDGTPMIFDEFPPPMSKAEVELGLKRLKAAIDASHNIPKGIACLRSSRS